MPNARSARGLTPARASYYYELEARLRGLDSKKSQGRTHLKARKGFVGKGRVTTNTVDGNQKSG